MLPLNLTIEQEFQLKVMAESAEKLSDVDARAMLLEVIRQGMIKDNMVKHFMKKELGGPCC
jgi:Phycobilisome degradation protein nblA